MKKMFRTAACILLLVAMVFAVTGCSSKEPKPAPTATPQPVRNETVIVNPALLKPLTPDEVKAIEGEPNSSQDVTFFYYNSIRTVLGIPVNKQFSFQDGKLSSITYRAGSNAYKIQIKKYMTFYDAIAKEYGASFDESQAALKDLTNFLNGKNTSSSSIPGENWSSSTDKAIYSSDKSAAFNASLLWYSNLWGNDNLTISLMLSNGGGLSLRFIIK